MSTPKAVDFPSITGEPPNAPTCGFKLPCQQQIDSPSRITIDDIRYEHLVQHSKVSAGNCASGSAPIPVITIQYGCS